MLADVEIYSLNQIAVFCYRQSG